MSARLTIIALLFASARARDTDDLRPLLAAKEAKSVNSHQGVRTSEPAGHTQQTEPAQSDSTQGIEAPEAVVDDAEVDADTDENKPQQDEAPPSKAAATHQPHEPFGKQTASTADPVMNGLKVELASLKRNKINVDQLQHTEAASRALVREGQEMMRGATSKHSRQAYERQVHSSETVEKEALGLMQDGKAAAAEDARAALHEAAVVQKVAQALASEANSQLKLFAKAVAPARKASNASNSDDADDDVDMD